MRLERRKTGGQPAISLLDSWSAEKEQENDVNEFLSLIC